MNQDKQEPIDTRRRLREALADAASCTWPQLTGVPEFWVKPAPQGRGEFATNLALVLAAELAQPASTVARRLRDGLDAVKLWPGRIEEANGFLNFAWDNPSLAEGIERAVHEGPRYGAGTGCAGQRINVEFVSAEPTGPLSLSAGRYAAIGDALCRLLEFQGADVTREFFLNDLESSSRLRLLGESVAALYLDGFNRAGQAPAHPEGALHDEFYQAVAASIVEKEGNSLLLLPNAERAAFCGRRAVASAVASIKRTLLEFGVRFDVWTSESALLAEGRIRAMDKLGERGYTYPQGGATWLRTTAFGDEADRPLLRPSQAGMEPTYLASDIAYHAFKFARGFDRLLNIWSAQHRPYIERTRAALEASGCQVEHLEVFVCEGARLLRDGTPVPTGRGGGGFSLEETLADADRDMLRFTLVVGNWDETTRIELETINRDDQSNPAYAALLAPSRLATMIGEEEALAGAAGATDVPLGDHERELARLVKRWPDEAEAAAIEREPQRVARYVLEIAEAARQLLLATRPAQHGAGSGRLQLLRAAQICSVNALRALGIEARDRF